MRAADAAADADADAAARSSATSAGTLDIATRPRRSAVSTASPRRSEMLVSPAAPLSSPLGASTSMGLEAGAPLRAAITKRCAAALFSAICRCAPAPPSVCSACASAVADAFASASFSASLTLRRAFFTRSSSARTGWSWTSTPCVRRYIQNSALTVYAIMRCIRALSSGAIPGPHIWDHGCACRRLTRTSMCCSEPSKSATAFAIWAREVIHTDVNRQRSAGADGISLAHTSGGRAETSRAAADDVAMLLCYFIGTELTQSLQ